MPTSSSNAALLDPRRLTAAIASLAQSTPKAALIQLDAWLIGLRSEAARNANALNVVLPLIDLSVREHYRDATRQVLSEGGKLGALERQRLFEIVDSCLARLADIHQALAVHWANGGKDGANRIAAAAVFVAAVRACAALRKWARLMRHEVRPGVWQDLCSLYAEALACGRATSPCPVMPASPHVTSVEREWLKACALAAVDADRLQPEHLDVIERAIELCAGQLVVSTQHDTRHVLAVDLESGELFTIEDAKGIEDCDLRYLGVAAGEFRLRDLLRQVNAGRLGPTLFGQPGKRIVTEALALASARLEKR